MAELALPLLIASTAVSAVGSIAAGNAQAAQYEAAAKASRYNAAVQRQQAAQVGAQTAREEERQRRAGRAAIAEQYTAVSQAGIAPQSGSARLSLENAATMAELDALTIRYRGTVVAQGHSADAALRDYEARAAKRAAKRARMAGYIGAASNILSGASSYARGTFKSPVAVNT